MQDALLSLVFARHVVTRGAALHVNRGADAGRATLDGALFSRHLHTQIDKS
jgi:hypothetical protein